jgi:hypothetical protein
VGKGLLVGELADGLLCKLQLGFQIWFVFDSMMEIGNGR